MKLNPFIRQSIHLMQSQSSNKNQSLKGIHLNQVDAFHSINDTQSDLKKVALKPKAQGKWLSVL